MSRIIKEFEGVDVKITRLEDGYYIPEDSLTPEQVQAVRYFICGYVAGFFRDINQAKDYLEVEYNELSRGENPPSAGA